MDEHDEMNKFVKHLAIISDRTWKRYIREKRKGHKETHEKLIDTGFLRICNHPYNENIMINLLEKNHIKIEGIILKPIDKEPYFIPLLSINWDFRASESDNNSFRLDMVSRDKQMLSVRFDQCSPDSDHNFFHVQINKVPEGMGFKPLLPWLPDKRPCIPLHDILRKKSPVSLLILLYGSLYGFKRFKKDFSGSRINRDFYEVIKPFS